MHLALVTFFLLATQSHQAAADTDMVKKQVDKCFKEAMRNRDLESLTELVTTPAGESCRPMMSPDNKTAYYSCNETETKIENCHTKTPELRHIKKPNAQYREKIEGFARRIEEDAKKCFKKAKINTQEGEDKSCYFQMSDSEKTAIKVCKTHVTEVVDCASSKPMIRHLNVTIKDYKGLMKQPLFPEMTLSPMTSKEVKLAESCKSEWVINSADAQKIRTEMQKLHCSGHFVSVGYDAQEETDKFMCSEAPGPIKLLGLPTHLMVSKLQTMLNPVKNSVLVTCPTGQIFFGQCP